MIVYLINLVIGQFLKIKVLCTDSSMRFLYIFESLTLTVHSTCKLLHNRIGLKFIDYIYSASTTNNYMVYYYVYTTLTPKIKGTNQCIFCI